LAWFLHLSWCILPHGLGFLFESLEARLQRTACCIAVLFAAPTSAPAPHVVYRTFHAHHKIRLLAESRLRRKLVQDELKMHNVALALLERPGLGNGANDAANRQSAAKVSFGDSTANLP
jgi:hypothetical protein